MGSGDDLMATGMAEEVALELAEGEDDDSTITQMENDEGCRRRIHGCLRPVARKKGTSALKKRGRRSILISPKRC